MAAVCSLFSLAFAPPQPAPHHSAVRQPAVGMSAADITVGWQSAALQKLVDSLELQPKDYPADMGYDTFTIGGASGQVLSYEAPGKSNIAWCSGLSISDGADVARASVTAWCGPLSDVPHLCACAGVSDGGIDLWIDFKPRDECGYDPSGEYPEPDSREAFMKGGNRKDFAAAFYTEEMVAWRDAILALDGAENAPITAEEMESQSVSPLYLDMRLPLTEEAATAAAKACAEACDAWLTWMQTSTENKRDLPAGAKQTQVYARDTKVKANAYGALLKRYGKLYGEADGKGLAAVDAGPLDEAYVGGAS